MQGESPAWGRYLLTAYAIGDRPYLEFVTGDRILRPGDDGLPRELRHIGLAVASHAEVVAWKDRLTANGIAFTEESFAGEVHLHFADPNGVAVELTTEADTRSMRMAEAEALAVVTARTAAAGSAA